MSGYIGSKIWNVMQGINPNSIQNVAGRMWNALPSGFGGLLQSQTNDLLQQGATPAEMQHLNDMTRSLNNPFQSSQTQQQQQQAYFQRAALVVPQVGSYQHTIAPVQGGYGVFSSGPSTDQWSLLRVYPSMEEAQARLEQRVGVFGGTHP